VAFRFPLETVLKHRKRQEEMAQREFMESQSVVEACLRGIEAMYQSIDDTRNLIAVHEKSGTYRDLQLIQSSQLFIEGQKRRVHAERLKARELIRDLEMKQEILIEKLHERKIMDKLKERRFEEYKVRIAMLEQKELDDLTSARMGGGRR
jgi:flagellar protein FliJ